MEKITDLISFEGLENNNYEFKVKLETSDDKVEKWAKTIVGFANCNSGYLLIGVTDDGLAIGLTKKETDETKNLILLTINRKIFPHVSVKFKTVKCNNEKYVLSVFVDSINELVIFKAGDFNEKVYVRENGSTIPASIAQIVKLSNKKFGIDGHFINKQYEKKDFSMFNKLAKEYRIDKKEPTEKMLINSEIINQDGRISEGLEMFSDYYENDDTLVCCRLWNGFNKGVDEVIDKKEFKGSISNVFIEAMNFIERNSRSGFIKMENGARLDTFSYPEIALREAIVNAIAHRDYSIIGTQIDIDIYKDRLEITSPGSWLLSKSPEEYELNSIPSIRRNKVICNCFEVIGLMEKSGSGLKKIYETYKKFNVKMPVLYNSADFFTIIFYDLLNEEEAISKEIGPYDIKILKYCDGVARSREEIKNYIGYKSTPNFTKNILTPLVKAGLLITTAKKFSKNQKYLTKK